VNPLRKIFFAAADVASSLSRQVVICFFLAIGATVAGGLYTALRPAPANLADADNPDGQSRFPSSVVPGSVIGDGSFRVNPPPQIFGRGPDSSSGGASAPRTDDIANPGGNQPNAPVAPIGVTPANAPNNNPAAPPAVAAQNALKTNLATNTGTSTSTGTNTNPYGQFGGSVNGTNTSTDTGTNTSTSTAASISIPNASGLKLSGTAAGWILTCQKLTLSFLASNGMTMPTTQSYSISFATTAGTVYSDAGCTTPLSTLAVPAYTYTGTVYFADTAAATDTISASEPTLGTATFKVTLAEPAASEAEGQPNLTSSAPNNPSTAAGVSTPGDALVVGNQLFVADTANNRVLGWNSIPTASGKAPDFVLGQPDFNTVTLNSGGAASGFTMSAPTALASDGTRLFVADTGNSRVLIWNTLPSATHVAANVAMGQPNLSSDTANQGLGAASALTLSGPTCVLVSSGKVYVCDGGNNRVLAWNSVPTAQSVAANFAVGQPDLVTSTAGTTASKLSAPKAALISGTRLYVVDSSNNRVVAWNTLPTANGTAANFALGQVNLTSSATADNATGLSAPTGIALDSQGRLFVSDTGYNRVLIWNSEPSANGTAANAVIGQPSLTTQLSNNGGLNASGLSAPANVRVNGSQLWVSDKTNDRVLEYALP
jgi:hypothetical protein